MARRNHSRRVHTPYGDQGIGYAEESGGRQESGIGRGDEGWDDEGQGESGPWGGVQRMVSERPHSSLMTAFGVGFGLGLLVTLLLNREEETWFERYAPDAIQDLPDRLRHAGHKVSDSMSGSFKHAGESLGSYVPNSWKRW
jgi:hypothetical protein